MDWGDIPGWIALAVASGAGVLSWKSLRWERLSAEAATRSAEAAERSNAIAQRAVGSRASGDRSGASEADETPQTPPDVTWRIENPSANRYVLRNTGTEVAEDVHVDEAQAAVINRNIPRGAVVRPGEGVDMLLMGTFGHPIPNQLYVRWSGHPDWLAVPLVSVH